MDLAELLGVKFDHVGVGRNDGKEAGEYSPIFFDRERFEVANWTTIWLSDTPNVPGSVGWDAVSEQQVLEGSMKRNATLAVTGFISLLAHRFLSVSL